MPRGSATTDLCLLFVVTVLLSACASTPYQAAGSGRFGYNDIQVGEDLYRVSFSGSQYTPQELAYRYVLLRASELTLEGGFRYFAVVGEYTASNQITTGTTVATPIGGGAVGTTMSSTARLPSVGATIRCWKEKPNVSGVVYDAIFLRDQVLPTVKVGPTPDERRKRNQWGKRR